MVTESEILNHSEEPDWIKKSIEIKASDDKVWEVLTTGDMVTEWAAPFGLGTTVESHWTENAPVTWKDGNGNHIMKGKVEISYPAKMLKVGFYEGINTGEDDELGEYKEHYLLSEREGKTTLRIESGPLTDEYIEKVSPQWDSALTIIKTLSEK